jgi:cytochrome c
MTLKALILVAFVVIPSTFVAGLAGLAMSSAASRSPSALPPHGDERRGAALFQERCTACHSPTLVDNATGPALSGVYGRAAASAPGYRYSKALRGSGRVWTSSALDEFLTNTTQAVPGTYMPVQALSAQQRADLIAFLRQHAK